MSGVLSEIVCLGVLSERAAASGYDIARVLRSGNLRFVASIGLPAIYASLKRLERDGLVDSHAERTEGRPDRIAYSVTPAGRAGLVLRLSAIDVAGRDGRRALRVAIWFGDLVGGENLCRLIGDRRRYLGEAVARLEEARRMEQRPQKVWALEAEGALVNAELSCLDKLTGLVDLLR